MDCSHKWIALGVFCSLKAFHAALETEWKWWSPNLSTLVLRDPGFESLGASLLSEPSRKSSLCLHSMLTQFVTRSLCLRYTTCFWVPKPCRLLRCTPAPAPPLGRKGGESCLGSAAHWAPAWRAVSWLCCGSRFMAILGSLTAASFPTPCPEALRHSSTSGLPGTPETTLSQ